MKYLFFDIECSNCFNGIGKMCEFGYVLTDENFKIIKARDIPMSPGKGRGNRFHLRDRMKVEDVNLAYEEDYYFSQPELPAFYQTIKKMMEDKDTICFAFSMDNDIRYLYDSCKKYNLPELNYTCYDVQRIAANHLEIKNQPNLKKCVLDLVGPHSFVGLEEHLSRDDAKMAMMVLEAICVLQQKDSKTLLSESEYAKVNSMEFINNFINSASERAFKKELKLYLIKVASKDSLLLENEEFVGKRCKISPKLFSTIDEWTAFIKLIHEKQFLFTRNPDFVDFYIVKDEEELEKVRTNMQNDCVSEIYTLDKFTSNVLKESHHERKNEKLVVRL